MRIVLAAVLVAALAACSAHTRVRVDSGASVVDPRPPVAHAAGSGAHVRLHAGSAGTAILVLALLAAGIYEYTLERDGVRYAGSPFVLLQESAPRYAPPLAPGRHISEQDCSRPLDASAGNLRCK